MDTNQAAAQSPEPAEQNIIHFADGILGFEEVHDYLLYHEDDNNIIWSLQAADSDIPSFIVVDPFTVFPGYSPVLSAQELAYFGEKDVNDLCFLVIAVIKPELGDSVVNLKAPIIIDINTREAKQSILEDSEYPIRHKLFEKKD
jgi:Uncharacterized protein conserved in bacteria